MLSKLTAKLANFALRNVNLTIEDRNSIVIHILDNLGALPFRDIITTNDDGETLINNRPLELEQVKSLRESARNALDNKALKLIREQVAFTAIALGVHKVESERQMLFARAALWCGQQEEEHLKILAQRNEEPAL